MKDPGSYDTVSLYSEYEPSNFKGITSRVFVDKQNGRGYTKAQLSQGFMLYSERGTKLTLSLPGYLKGSNFYSLSLSEVRESIESISEDTGIDWSLGLVNRIDFKQDIIVENLPHRYFDCLGVLSKMSRNTIEGSLYYNKNTKREKRSLVLTFYDKSKELTEKGKSHPIELKRARILRYESRYQRIKDKFGTKITGADLWNEALLQKVKDLHLNHFRSIEKVYPPALDVSKIRRPKQLYDLLSGYAIHTFGLSHCLELVDDLGSGGSFRNRTAVYEAKTGLKKLSRQSQALGKSPLTDELIHKIEML